MPVEFSLRDKLLVILHNLCAIRPEKARAAKELSRFLLLGDKEVEKALEVNEAEGYAKSFVDVSGAKRYYLSPLGILRACSLFT